MRGRTVAAYAAGGTTVAFAAAGGAFIVVNWPLPLQIAEWGFPGFQGVAALVFAAVGMAVALRRPANPIGWLLLVAAVMSGLQFVGHQYAVYGLVKAPGTVPAPSVGTWIEEWIWVPIIACMGVFTFLLFPTGRLLTPRWRFVGWVAALSMVAGSIGTSVAPPVRVPGAVNPLAPAGPPGFTEPLLGIGIALIMGSLVAAIVSLLMRFRRSVGIERQQLKWLAFGAMVIGVAGVVYVGMSLLTGDPHNPASALFAASLFAVPLAIASAMLRYGLYEVDRLINRTVVYGLVSVVLGGLYAASVLVLQGALTWLTNGQTLAVAGSTLMVAAIFQPVRRRIQQAVDRRFNRARYDARRTVEAFGTRLRDQVNLQELRSELAGVVAETMQPTSIGVWLRRTDR